MLQSLAEQLDACFSLTVNCCVASPVKTLTAWHSTVIETYSVVHTIVFRTRYSEDTSGSENNACGINRLAFTVSCHDVAYYITRPFMEERTHIGRILSVHRRCTDIKFLVPVTQKIVCDIGTKKVIIILILFEQLIIYNNGTYV